MDEYKAEVAKEKKQKKPRNNVGGTVFATVLALAALVIVDFVVKLGGTYRMWADIAVFAVLFVCCIAFIIHCLRGAKWTDKKAVKPLLYLLAVVFLGGTVFFGYLLWQQVMPLL